MKKQGPDQFLAELILSESTKSVLVLSSSNLQPLIEKLEDSLERLMVIPSGDFNLQETFDMCIVLEDVQVSKTQLGLIKNSVAQKIVVIRESVDNKDHKSFLELGFAFDPEISFKKIYSYNLQTYNKKRGWNNSDGWANPENFEKFRW
jgi:hypothetical protein|tara:strand:- start:1279 stop:1722 length:444 start_codon:yes stop_codon:yes gene_type:complete